MSAPPRTILLIDDDELSRAVLELHLTDAGYAVIEATDGAAALATLERLAEPIACVLCDLKMPGLAGEALLSAMRPLLPPGTPVLAMSGSEPTPAAIANFDSFLLKGTSPEQLREAIEMLLQTPSPSLLREGQPAILPQLAATGDTQEILDETAFAPLCQMLRTEQLVELFTLSFRELDKHLARMQQAIHTGDHDTMHHSAHTVKGSFAIVGARELQALGAFLEGGTGTFADKTATLARIPLAADRLRRMLSTRGVHLELLPPSDQERS